MGVMDDEIENASAHRLLLHSILQLLRLVHWRALETLSNVAWDWLGVSVMLATLVWQLMACFAFFGILGFLVYTSAVVAVCSSIISRRKCQT